MGLNKKGGTEERDQRGGWSAALMPVFTHYFNRLFKPNDVKLLPEVDLHGVSWNSFLAFISGPNNVIIHDYEDSEVKEPSTLSSESQREVKLLEWRPNGGRTLSVACKGGICLWAASYPGNAASVRSGVSSSSLSRGSGYRWTLVDFLQSPDNEQISALSWSPDGKYLASGSYESSSFTIWDVAQVGSSEVLETFQGQSHFLLMARSSKDRCFQFVGAVAFAALILLYFDQMFFPRQGNDSSGILILGNCLFNAVATQALHLICMAIY